MTPCSDFASRPRGLSCVLAALVCLALISSCAAAGSAADRPPAALLWLDGPTSGVGAGEEFTISLRLDDASNVYGLSVSVGFDQTYLEVLDDGAAPGIQITPGDCPSPNFVVANSADNAAGTIEYAVSQLMPTPPCSGGLVAEIRFRALGEATTVVEITDSIVADPEGWSLPHETQGFTVEIVLGGLLWLSGPAGGVEVGDEFTAEIRFDDISDVYGVQISLGFDQTSLEVVDDGAEPGIQIAPGSCPSPDLVVANTADNGAGTVEYAVTQLEPTPPCGGGLVATIRFRAVDDGVALVQFIGSVVSDPAGSPISHGTRNLSVAVAPPTALLWLDGPGEVVFVGGEFTAALRLDDFSDVYGLTVSLGFDPARLEVLDDGPAPGIQIAPGDCPSPDFVAANAADNGAGTIEYAVTQLAPTPPCSGGLVAQIRFRVLGSGTTSVELVASEVTDPEGAPMPHGTQDLSVVVAPGTALLWLDGPGEGASVGSEFPVHVRLVNLSDVYGLTASISFDPTHVQVLDDGPAPGIQIAPGDCPSPDFVVTNSADNVAGTVQYAVTQLAPTPPCSGGIVAEIRFVGLLPGTTPVGITSSVVSDMNGLSLAHDTEDLILEIGASPVEETSWGMVKALYR